MKPLIYPGNVRIYRDKRGHRVVWYEGDQRRSAQRANLEDAIELAVSKSRGTAGAKVADPSTATLADVADEWLTILQDAEGRSASYVSKQRKYLEGHLLPDLPGPVHELTRAQLAGVAAKVRQAGVSDGYATQLLGTLNRVWKYATMAGFVPQDRAGWASLAVRGKRLQGHSREYIDPSQRPSTEAVGRLVGALRDSGDWGMVRAVILGSFSGLRWGETAALEWGDIDAGTGEVHVARQVTYVDGVRDVKLPKREKVRDTILPAAALDQWGTAPWLDSLLVGHSPLVCPAPSGDYWTPQAFHRKFAKAKEAAGWPKDWTFHSLRHHFATWCLGKGIPIEDVAMMMGHSSPDVTMRTYIGVVEGALARARELTRDL